MLTKSIIITTNSNDIDWEIFRECSFAIMGGEQKEGMTYEEYKKKHPMHWDVAKETNVAN